MIAEIDQNRNLYLTDILRVRESFPTFARMAAGLLDRRGVSVVLAEGNGTQRGIFDQFQEITRAPMVVVGRTTDKHIRAAGAQPYVQGGKVRIPCDTTGKILASFQPVLDEVVSFPAAAHDDCVDVLVDLCMEAMRGSISATELNGGRILKPTGNGIFSPSTPKRSIFMG